MRLRKRIDARAPQSGPTGRPTINDVARLAHVSKKTVSRVINNSPLVREETREKIGAIISELGFSPDAQARGLAFRRSFLIGMICDDPLPPNTLDMQQGVLDALHGTGFELVIRACNPRDAKFLTDMRDFVAGHKTFRRAAGAAAHRRKQADRSPARNRLSLFADSRRCRRGGSAGSGIGGRRRARRAYAPVRSLKNAITRRSV